MLQTTLHKKIKTLYERYPRLIEDSRLLEFILLTMPYDLQYLMRHEYEDLKYLLSDRRLDLNSYRDAPTVESIARAARHVREEMGIETNDKRSRRELEMRTAYSTQSRLEM